MADRSPSHHHRKKSSATSPLIIALFSGAAILVCLSLGLRVLLYSGVPAEVNNAAVDTMPTEEAGSGSGSFLDLFQGNNAGTAVPETSGLPDASSPIAEATISVTGDILMHLPVINGCKAQDGSYDFNGIFRYLLPYSESADYSIANLETTLCGDSAGYKYSGYPAFNCPDEITDALKTAGFDALTTANNHCYDTSEYGFLRTVKTVRDHGLSAFGTRLEENEPAYSIIDLNGIRFGIVCYTYEGQPENPQEGVVYMNWNALSPKCASLINSFLPEKTDVFIQELNSILTQMRLEGAEATVMLIHWGTEYELAPSAQQTEIAQQLCDLGFDVIVGGHPHVIQPISLLTSRTDPQHKTICLYSTGNAVSNQRISEMNLKTGHTEDGVLFSFTFAKYADNTVQLRSADLLPCWVDLRTSSLGNDYVIIPLDAKSMDSWQDRFSLSSSSLESARKSYERTIALTGSGLSAVQNWLDTQEQYRESGQTSVN